MVIASVTLVFTYTAIKLFNSKNKRTIALLKERLANETTALNHYEKVLEDISKNHKGIVNHSWLNIEKNK